MNKSLGIALFSLIAVLLGIAPPSFASYPLYNTDDACPKKFFTEKHLGLKPFVLADGEIKTVLTTNLHYSDFEDTKTGYICSILLTANIEPILMFWAELPKNGEDHQKPPHYVWLRGKDGTQYKARWYTNNIPFPLSSSLIIENINSIFYEGFKIIGVRFTLKLDNGDTIVREHYFIEK